VILSNPCQQDQISQDLIMNYGTIHPSLGTTIHHQLNHVNIVIPKKKRLLGTNKVNDDDLKLKKIMHRDLERQRRQGMSALHSSLTSLLFIHYVKEKRGKVEFTRDIYFSSLESIELAMGFIDNL
ncbi:hypothetical protein MTR67_027283, partial [Solanum verrucosum]